MWILDTETPTMDAGESVATLDGWSAELAAFVVSATVTVRIAVGKVATIKQHIDEVLVWHTT